MNGSLDVSIGAVEDADLVVETWTRSSRWRTASWLRDAVASGVARAEGDPAAIDRCFRVLSIAPRVTAAA